MTTYSTLRAAGTTRRQLDAMVASGSVDRIRRGVYAFAGACDPVRVAASHGGPPACVTAARHLGLWVLDDSDDVHVWLRGDGHAYEHDECGCIGHWDDAKRTDPFRLPSVPRVLRQVVACRGVEQFFVAVESAMNKRLLTRAGLAWLRASTGPDAREALDFAGSTSESGLESLLRWRLRGIGVPVRTQVEISSVGRVDFVFGDRLIVELDGAEHHDGTPFRHRDLMRDANAAVWGFITLRFDYAMVVHDWEIVELAIRSMLDRNLHLLPAR